MVEPATSSAPETPAATPSNSPEKKPGWLRRGWNRMMSMTFKEGISLMLTIALLVGMIALFKIAFWGLGNGAHISASASIPIGGTQQAPPAPVASASSSLPTEWGVHLFNNTGKPVPVLVNGNLVQTYSADQKQVDFPARFGTLNLVFQGKPYYHRFRSGEGWDTFVLQ